MLFFLTTLLFLSIFTKYDLNINTLTMLPSLHNLLFTTVVPVGTLFPVLNTVFLLNVYAYLIVMIFDISNTKLYLHQIVVEYWICYFIIYYLYII